MHPLRFILTVFTLLFSLNGITDDCIGNWRCWVRPPTSGNLSQALETQTLALEYDGLKQIEYMIAKAQAYAQKKQECKDEITGCVYQLSSAAGKPFLDAGAVDACLDTYPKCEGVHACDQNGEVIPFKPDPPKTVNDQAPAPYIYGQMACEKQLIVNSEGQQWYEYVIKAPTLCNPVSNPANGPITIKFKYSEKYKPKVALCEPSDPAQTGITFYDLWNKQLDGFFSVTTVGNLLDKMIAYAKSKNNIEVSNEYIQYKNNAQGLLNYKACMISFPQDSGVDFALGAVPGVIQKFPPKYYIAQLKYGYMVSLKTMQITNVSNYYPPAGGTPYVGPNPDQCVIELGVE